MTGDGWFQKGSKAGFLGENPTCFLPLCQNQHTHSCIAPLCEAAEEGKMGLRMSQLLFFIGELMDS